MLLIEIHYETVYTAPETEIGSTSRSEVSFRTYARFTGKKVGEFVDETLLEYMRRYMFPRSPSPSSRTSGRFSPTQTQTRRRHRHQLKVGKVYEIKRGWFHKTGYSPLITRVYRQRLGEITPEECLKGDLRRKGVRDVWRRINGGWDLEEEIIVYEFDILDFT